MAAANASLGDLRTWTHHVISWSQISGRWIFFTSLYSHRHSKKKEPFSCGFKCVFVSRFHCSTEWSGGGHCGLSYTAELVSLEDPGCWERKLGSMPYTLTLLPDSIYGQVVLNVNVTCYMIILLLQRQTKFKAPFFAWNLCHGSSQNFSFKRMSRQFGYHLTCKQCKNVF